MADSTGFEPAVSSVTGKCVGPLHHESIKSFVTVSEIGVRVNGLPERPEATGARSKG